MIKRIISLILCVGLLPALAGLALAQRESRETLRDEWHQTYQLAPGGRLTLRNINGAAHIQGWERNEVRIDAVKRAYKRERLDEAHIEVHADSDSIDIRTRYPYDEMNFTDDYPGRYDNPASVEYTLSVPRGVRLENLELINGGLDLSNLSGEIHASCINGKLTARDLSGEAKLSTINGTLDAAFAQLNADKPLSLNSVNGEVLLTIPSDANAEIKATTVHGAITNNFGLPVHRGRYVGTDLAGRIGNGSARIRLDNVNGVINVRHASDGRPLSPVTNLLTNTQDDDYGPSQEEIQRQVAREVEQAMREAERARAEAERAGEEARREGEQAQREAERERAEAQREAQREQSDAQREAEQARAEAQREAEEARREAERERAESLREAEQEREQAKREQEAAAREVAEAQREAQREQADAQREAERERREAERARVEAERGQFVSDNYGNYALVERTTKSFAVQGTPRVRIETFDGPVTIEAWDKAEVEYTAIKRARDERAQRATVVRADQTGNEVHIIAEFDKAQTRVNGDTGAMVALEVHVPRNSDLNIHTGDGRVRLSGVNGEVELRTGDGAVDVTDGRGRLRVETGDGRVRIESFDGDAYAQTSDGRITLEGRFRSLTARTGDGGISLALPTDADATIETDAESVVNDGLATPADNSNEEKRVRHWRVGRGGGQIRLHTGDGSIYLRRIESTAIR
jgi:DUF4097 and DUF4098 domain-containing protein YvlB